MPTEHLIIFVKNPIPGQVKTRIGRTVGHDKAVEVYRQLLSHTQRITRMMPWHRVVYYGDFINPVDGWSEYEKKLQVGADLGERMQHAFAAQFAAGAQRVVIIGSDCLALQPDHLKQAFRALDRTDVVVGPATDGRYYLLGMKHFHSFLFENMPWSQPDLFRQTEQAVRQQGLQLETLETLADIDEWDDYMRAGGTAPKP